MGFYCICVLNDHLNMAFGGPQEYPLVQELIVIRKNGYANSYNLLQQNLTKVKSASGGGQETRCSFQWLCEQRHRQHSILPGVMWGNTYGHCQLGRLPGTSRPGFLRGVSLVDRGHRVAQGPRHSSLLAGTIPSLGGSSQEPGKGRTQLWKVQDLKKPDLLSQSFTTHIETILSSRAMD